MSQACNVMIDGVWRNNVVLTQMLSLCPALAVTSGATQGLGMGAATVVVLIASNVLVALLRGLITDEVRIPAFVLIIATLVTMVDLAMNAWLHELHKVLGLFIPLIVVNCMILGGLSLRRLTGMVQGRHTPDNEKLAVIAAPDRGLPRT